MDSGSTPIGRLRRRTDLAGRGPAAPVTVALLAQRPPATAKGE